MNKDTKPINIKVPVWLYDKIKAKAAKEGNPMAAWIRRILGEAINQDQTAE